MPAVVLDFDGLMIDSEYEIAMCVIEAFASRSAAVTVDEIAHLFGSTDLDHEWQAILAERFGGSFTVAELDAELSIVAPARIDALSLLPGVEQVLDAAARDGWRIGLATGQTRARLDQHLTRLGLRDRFDAIVTRKEVPLGKPAPDIYIEAASRLATPPDQCVAIEDSLSGCQSALAAGMTVVVCPSRVTAGCTFPTTVRRVRSLDELRLDGTLRHEPR